MRSARATITAWRGDESGGIALIFGLSATVILLVAGAGIDLSRAFQARQKLSEVATLACQYASRPSVVQMANPAYVPVSGGATYASAVNDYITAALVSQQLGWRQTNSRPFTYTANGPADVSLTAVVPTAFMQLAGIDQMPISAASHCYTTTAQVQPPPTSNLLEEGFEAGGCNGCVKYIQIPGQSWTTPGVSFVTTSNYTGSSGTVWYTMGHCLETDPVGNIKSTVPEGTRSAELDCENGANNAGNSSISTRVYLSVGNHELRYFFAGRVNYANYNPTSLCGSTAADLSWANDTNSSGGPVANALRSNQINVYLDPDANGTAPLHSTILGNQKLAGSKLIDMCVNSTEWVERSIRIYVTSAGYHWLTFAADGLSDSFGGQIDKIRLCPETCAGTVQDNYPRTWLAAGNGGFNKILFEDRFESPSYAGSGCGSNCASTGNLNLSTGTSGAATSGWPNLASAGWATGNFNQMDYYLTGAAEGSRSIELDATRSGSMSTSNRLISRPFLLVPGYYKVEYYYRSNRPLSGVSGVYCGATPAAAGLNISFPSGYDTNIAATFLSHSQLVSTPIGGGALYSTTSYLNPTGTTTTTPTVAPNAISLSNYDSSQPNALLDICGYGTSWQTRLANILITKPGTYWLTQSALGTADNGGASIDDVKLTALGSPGMASPPSAKVTIPAPNPQAGARVTTTSYYIVANPLNPPAALQQ